MGALCERRTVGGIIEVCCHYVSWWFDLDDVMLTDELRKRLEAEAEERAKAMIIEGFHSGDLCHFYCEEKPRTITGRFAKGEYELFGWWSIKS